MKSLFDVFISYGRKESKQFAIDLHARLVQEGLNLWFDQQDIPPSVDYQKQIDDGIERARNFIFIIAPHAVKSPYCRLEIELALKCGKRIIPLYQVEPADCWDKMHPVIQKLNWIYFDGSQPFEDAFAKLTASIRLEAEYVDTHTRILNRALEWERNQKQTRYLLSGDPRRAAEDWLRLRFTDGQRQAPCRITDLHAEYICDSIKNAHNLMSEVFISYAENADDVAAFHQVRSRLHHEAITVWAEEPHVRDSRGELDKDLKQAIEKADNLLFLASPASRGASRCNLELEYADSLNKRIVVLNLSAERGGLPSEIKDPVSIDFLEISQARGFDTLLALLSEDAAYYQRHKVLLVSALKWQEQNRNPSVLLRGYDLNNAEAWLKAACQRRKHLPLALHEEFIQESLARPADLTQEVFISYSRADADFARKLNDALQTQGKSTWFDQESIAAGADFQQEIFKGIENSDNFVFVISPQAVESPYCREEVEFAASLNKRFISLRYREVAEETLPAALAAVQWIDFTQAREDFYSAFSEFIRALDTDREHVHDHTKWGLRALEWKQDKSDDLLLRGNEFAVAQTWLEEAQDAAKRPRPTPLHQEFISASLKAIEAQKRYARRIELIVRGLLTVSVIALLVAVAMFFEAQEQRDAARANARIAMTRDLGGKAVLSAVLPTPVNGGSDRALLLAAQGYLFRPRSTETANNLLYVLSRQSYLNHYVAHLDSLNFDLDYSPDQKRIAVTTGTEVAFLDTPADLQYRLLPQRLRDHRKLITTLCFTPDNHGLITGTDDGEIRFWDLRTFQADGKPIQAHAKRIGDIMFSRGGEYFISVGYDTEIHLWDAQTRQRLATLSGHQDIIYEVSAHPHDPDLIFTASKDGTVKIWSLSQRSLIDTIALAVEGNYGANAMEVSPDGKFLAIAGDIEELLLYDLSTKRLAKTLYGHKSWVNKLTFNRDGSRLVSASADKTVIVWDIAAGTALIPPLRGHAQTVIEADFTPDGKHIVSIDEEGHMALWNLEPEPPLGQIILDGHQGEIKSVDFHPHEDLFASAAKDHTIRLWRKERTHFTQDKVLRGHTDAVYQAVFSADGERLASAGADQSVRIWNWRQGRAETTFTHHDDQEVGTVAWSMDGEYLASGAGNTVYLWRQDAPSEPLQRFSGHTDKVMRVRFSPDGRYLASCGRDALIHLWRLDRADYPRTVLSGHRDWVNDVLFTPDSRTLVSAADDRLLMRWDVVTGKRLGKPLLGHSDWIWTVALYHDEGTGIDVLVSGSEDTSIQFWNASRAYTSTGQPLFGHGDVVRALALSKGARYMASAGKEEAPRLLVWNLDPEFWVEIACKMANRNLTEDEWDAIIGPPYPYRKTCE